MPTNIYKESKYPKVYEPYHSKWEYNLQTPPILRQAASVNWWLPPTHPTPYCLLITTTTLKRNPRRHTSLPGNLKELPEEKKEEKDCNKNAPILFHTFLFICKKSDYIKSAWKRCIKEHKEYRYSTSRQAKGKSKSNPLPKPSRNP